VPEWADPRELDPEVRRDLRGLSKEGSEFVGAHLFMAGMLAEEDPALAWRHARAARSKGGRIAVVRETVGLVAYHAGEWAEAISELRAARRMTGGPGQLPVMADCERALGHPEKSIELSRSAEAADLDPSSAAEMRIVVAGARADLGQLDAALAHLEGALQPETIEPFTARLFYAYADLLLQADRRAEAVDWFMKAAEADVDEETDAGERLTELAGESSDADSDELEGDTGAETRDLADDLGDDVDSLDLTAIPVDARDVVEGVVAEGGDVPAEVVATEHHDDARDDDAGAPGGLAEAGLADDDDDADLAENDEDESDTPGGDAVVGDVELESNVAAAAGDADSDEADSDYAANDMDAEDDTDDAPIRPANAPRSMGSLFSHNEGGR
jgi:tetratricopeptide (TPR) repeat protein